MLQKLAKGDNVVTNGGIIGVIVHATEQALTIRTAENTRIVVDRGPHRAQDRVGVGGRSVRSRTRRRTGARATLSTERRAG